MLEGDNNPSQSDMHVPHLDNVDHMPPVFVIVPCPLPKSVDELGT